MSAYLLTTDPVEAAQLWQETAERHSLLIVQVVTSSEQLAALPVGARVYACSMGGMSGLLRARAQAGEITLKPASALRHVVTL